PKLCFAAAASIRETEFPKRRSQTGVWERGFGLPSALLVPKLLFGNAWPETLFRGRGIDSGHGVSKAAFPNRSLGTRFWPFLVPKLLFGNAWPETLFRGRGIDSGNGVSKAAFPNRSLGTRFWPSVRFGLVESGFLLTRGNQWGRMKPARTISRNGRITSWS